MKPYRLLLIYILYSSAILAQQNLVPPGQQLKFNHVLGTASGGNSFITIAQDKYGFMWFGRYSTGLQRYDGSELKTYLHDPNDENTISNNWIECLAIDNDNIIWAGTWGTGLDMYDAAKNKFVHYRHNEKDPFTIASDTITALLADRAGNIWVGSYSGLDLLDKKTGRFIHYRHNDKDPQSLSYNEVRVIYEDYAGDIWAGCGRPWVNSLQTKEDGGLNRLDKKLGKFTRYMHNDADSTTIANNKVRAIFEDSKGIFWIGTMDDGLQTLDRKTGRFTHYYYDPKHPEKLSRPPQIKDSITSYDHIIFITEDSKGNILIGAHHQGINYYNRETQRVEHYGGLYHENGQLLRADTSTGLSTDPLWKTYTSKDGVIWIAAGSHIFTIRPEKVSLPHFAVNEKGAAGNTIFNEPGGNILWIGTDQGLFRKELNTNQQKVYKHDPANTNSLPNDTIASMKTDKEGNFWIGTINGLCRFEPKTEKFTNWYHDDAKPGTLSSNYVDYVYIDHENDVWIGTASTGVDKFDRQTGSFINYRYDLAKKNSLSNDYITGITEDSHRNIWISTSYGLNALNKSTGIISRYLNNSVVPAVYADSTGIVWTAAVNSVFYFDSTHHLFRPFENNNRHEEIQGVINIIGDKSGNLWWSTKNTIVRMNKKDGTIKIYDAENGVMETNFTFSDNFVNDQGKIFLGDATGYYAFNPESLTDSSSFFHINFTGIKIGDAEITSVNNNFFTSSLWDMKQINLEHKQNSFSFDFTAIDYSSPGDFKYSYRTENYDDDWRYTGSEHKVYFFNMQPGHYILHIKAVRRDGEWCEKIVNIIIAPPWWRTWLAYVLYGILFIAGSFAANRIIRNRIIEKERIKNREKELAQAKEIEKAYNELKLTQAQLIQSEKMASLGQLTAGIAHEIQNPLNFVNNFSDVNTELLEELKAEAIKGNINEVKAIADDVISNEQKINHHGKRADAIVKGMLQHSRSSTGQKEATDVNALADEYLRLSYHGFRAKDKSFNATMKTDFDKNIGNVNIIRQDIGRVLLNLYNNAFYAVNEKKKQTGDAYEPLLSVSTKKLNDKVEIRVGDNGNGIPQKVIDKIFQPFFTTKPTGQGTGLGLSLSYDIIKAHGGEIKVETKEGEARPDDPVGRGEGTEFIILIPI